jgi:hypothetical protein
MGESIYQGFTVGYALALSQFVMVWVLGAWYVRKASREWDPLAERARERAESARPQDAPPFGETSPMGISRRGPVREHEEGRR